MKIKIIAIPLIIASAFTILAGCSEGSSEVSEPTTVASTQPSTTEAVPIERDDIDYTASYDKENKKINTILTNNTGDDVIVYSHLYGLYKKVGNDWEATGFEYATYAMGNYLFPYDDMNSVSFSHSAYNTAGENINFAEEKEKGGLDAGEYKITMTFDVYPESEAKILPTEEDMTYPPENPKGMYFDSKEDEHEKVMVSAEFTVSDDKYDIDFTASYDKESTKVIATLTNNTGDDIISYNHGYSIYKKLKNGWLKLLNDNATYSVGLYLFPNDDRNSTEISFPTSFLSGERESLKAGEYKIDITINVYYESEINNLSFDPYDPHEEMTISAEFNVK